jgi:hypothetical protein
MPKLPAPRKRTTVSDVEDLQTLVVSELRHQFKNPPTDPETGERQAIPASTIAAAIKFIQGTGLRPTHDSPLADDVCALRMDLPFTAPNPDEF